MGARQVVPRMRVHTLDWRFRGGEHRRDGGAGAAAQGADGGRSVCLPGLGRRVGVPHQPVRLRHDHEVHRPARCVPLRRRRVLPAVAAIRGSHGRHYDDPGVRRPGEECRRQRARQYAESERLAPRFGRSDLSRSRYRWPAGRREPAGASRAVEGEEAADVDRGGADGGGGSERLGDGEGAEESRAARAHQGRREGQLPLPAPQRLAVTAGVRRHEASRGAEERRRHSTGRSGRLVLRGRRGRVHGDADAQWQGGRNPQVLHRRRQQPVLRRARAHVRQAARSDRQGDDGGRAVGDGPQVVPVDPDEVVVGITHAHATHRRRPQITLGGPAPAAARPAVRGDLQS
mmetsp:Transcript_17788/g.45573  ORF Transcript_17788/g.45573 Transcript_17788/m.45573 type:complete len:345 (-) Transcript_17788:1151-2185(-)